VSRKGQRNCWALLSMSGNGLELREGEQSSRVKDDEEKMAVKVR
jgi:hypothetical protein